MVASRVPRRRQQELVLDHLTALTNMEIRRFLKLHRVRGASAQAKDELRALIKRALGDGTITIDAVVNFLDEVTPWGKQHVYLYKSPSLASTDWRNAEWVTEHLRSYKLDDLLDAKTNRLVLPEELELASIAWTRKRLRVTAIRKREGWVRDEDQDSRRKADDGRPLWLKGYVYQVLRGITAFEWNLVADEAFLQITQLPTGASYENVADEFRSKVSPWLDLAAFQIIDVRPIIKKLHEIEEKGKVKAVSHALDYGRLGQRRISVRSDSTKVPLRGDKVLDGILRTVRRDGIPRRGDFFWDFDGATEAGSNTRLPRLHLILVAARNRVNFATPSTESGIRDVLTELRKLSS